ncbi:unnamed protein product [Camellia sinensis]
MKKLQTEIRAIARGKPTITEDDLDKMDYLKAVIKETLRLYHSSKYRPIRYVSADTNQKNGSRNLEPWSPPSCPMPIPREASQDVDVMGYHITAKTIVIINAWAIGRDPESWERPEEFWPERFFNSAVDFRGHDFELIPFGTDRRGCPGISFAMATNEIVLANLMHKFDWEFPEGVNGDMDRTMLCPVKSHHEDRREDGLLRGENPLRPCLLCIFENLRISLRRTTSHSTSLLQTGLFTLRQIKAATTNFDAANNIVESGFGSVYK